MLSDGGGFSVEDLRRELAASAGQMGKRAPSMLAFMSQRGVRRDKRKSRRKQPYQPGLALQSYLLQEAVLCARLRTLRLETLHFGRYTFAGVTAVAQTALTSEVGQSSHATGGSIPHNGRDFGEISEICEHD